MAATSLDLSQIKTDALNSASTFRDLVGLGAGDSATFSQAIITGGTVTASTPVINATQTWNDAAVTFTGMKLDVTDTASASDSLLMDLHLDASSRFKVKKEDGVDIRTIGNNNVWQKHLSFRYKALDVLGGYEYRIAEFQSKTSGGRSFVQIVDRADYQYAVVFRLSQDPYIATRSGGFFGWVNSNPDTNPDPSIEDLRLYRDAANTLAQRNGTNAQEYRLYNTYTDASNYERGFLKWDANVFKIGTEYSGTGTERNLQFDAKRFTLNVTGAASNIDCDLYMLGKGTANSRIFIQGGALSQNKIFSTGIGNTAQARQLDLCVATNPVLSLKEDRSVFITTGAVTASTPVLSLDQTWNNASVTFTAMKLDVTDTASAAGSLLMDLQVGGASKFKVDKTALAMGRGIARSSSGNYVTLDYGILFGTSSLQWAGVSSSGFHIQRDLPLTWTQTPSHPSSTLKLCRDADNTLAQRNGTNAQEFRLYNTYTDASNYERGFVKWDTNEFRIGTEGTGTGTSRNLAFNVIQNYPLKNYILFRIDSKATIAIGEQGIHLAPYEYINWSQNDGYPHQPGVGPALYRDAQNVLALRMTTSPQEFRIYNTYTGSTNYERAYLQWDTNTFKIGTEAGSAGGTVRDIEIDGNTTVNGAFSATTKSFLIDHPSKPGMKLRHGSLEGPENGVYVRGTTNYEKIILPDYWKDLIDEKTITVTLTPLHEFQPLFVKNKNCCEIEVGGCSGEYDYVVYGERKDVAKLEVEHWA